MLNKNLLKACLSATALLSSLALNGQAMGAPTMPTQLSSPVVNPDNTVTFNYQAPNAKKVQVSTQFAGTQDMTKNEKGVWSITLGPVTPDIYPYSFIVDGIQNMDPLNPDWFPNEKFKNMNEEIDKYTKAFDVIDLIFNTVSTGFNIYHTIDNVSNKISKYNAMLDAYNEKILSRGNIEPADTMLISINRTAINEIYSECQTIYGSITAIAVYSSGQLLASANAINLQIKRIDECLTRIQNIVNRAYFETYTFIQSRIRMWSRRIFTEKSRMTICNERFAVWRERSRNIKPR